MVRLILIIVLSSIAFSAHAKDSSAGPSNSLIRCQGINPKGRVPVGIDVELDPVDRLEAVTTWEKEATNPIFDRANGIDKLGAPSHFLKLDSKGNLIMFGFKVFNDGLEETISVLFVAGKPELTTLMLIDAANGQSYLAIGDVRCQLLK